MSRQIRNVVLSGGSYKGLEYIGVYQYLLERNMVKDINHFIGVSIGAVFAMLWYFNFTPAQMARVFSQLDWRRRHKLRTSLKGLGEAMKHLGLDDGAGFTQLFAATLLRKTGKADVTFAELAAIRPDRSLRIGLCNVSKTEFVLASAETTPDMPVALAMRISISLPIYFDPIEWHGDLWADGGVINNMPVEYFEHDKSGTLAFDFVCESELTVHPTSIGLLSLKLLLSLMNGQNIYKRTLFRECLCELRSSHKTALNEREIADVFDFFRFEFTATMINKFANEGYRDINAWLSPLLESAESEFSLDAVIRHLIWKALCTGRPEITFC
jgi:predicted acylesterase/phospholipase RssA